MSFKEVFDIKQRTLLAEHTLERTAKDAEQSRLTELAQIHAHRMDAEELKELSVEMHEAREDTTRQSLNERISAIVARSILLSAVEAKAATLEKHSTDWISRNVTAASAHQDRVRAIWRSEANLGDDIDAKIYEHALASALKGETLKPAPKRAEAEETTTETDPSETGETETPVETGKEDKMIDPVKIRDKILEHFAFNPAGLPAALRQEGNQQIYIDAIVTAVAALGHSPEDDEENAFKWSTATAAIMLVDGRYDVRDARFFSQVQRAVVELSGSADENSAVSIDGHKVPDASAASGFVDLTMYAPNNETQNIAVFDKSHKIIRRRLEKGDKVFLQSFAVAARAAIDAYPNHVGVETTMTPTVDAAYTGDIAAGASGGGGGGIANVELPPLNDPSGYNDEIERDNVLAVSTIYVSYQLEFAIKACARVLELFVAGLLPISASDGSARELDNLYWDQEDLLDEAARRSIYARVLGAPGGQLAFDMQPNSEFNTLLMRSISAISEYERELSAITHFDNAARGRRFQTTSGEFVRKAIRDFAANASLRGWAGTAFTAERMAKQVRRVMKVLSLPAVRNAFGVTTPWQVVERVSQREFGTTVNTVLHRTLADETQKIMHIVANRHTIWSNTSGARRLFSDTAENEGDLTYAESTQLIIAAQHFRAVTGIGDGMMNEYSEPVETYAAPSLPEGSGMSGFGGGGMQIDMSGVNNLRDLVNSGQTPSPDQILAMLPRM